MTTWTRVAPGSYEAPRMRVFTNCDCGHCPAWVAVVTDADGVEIDRVETLPLMVVAKQFAERMLMIACKEEEAGQ